MSTLAEFLRTWGALSIALLALVQPWVRALWRHFIWKPELIAHPAGTIEIGFSDLGPTIGLVGTVECRRRQTFVRSMDVRLIRRKDSLTHNFYWGIFRPLTLGGTQEGLQLSSGFLARPEEPYRYNIQFWEGNLQRELRPRLEALRQAWQDRVLERFGEDLQAVASGAAPAPAQTELRRQIEDLYREFSQEELHVRTYHALQRLCYWEPGDYTIELRVATVHPEAVHADSWEFTLEEGAVENLRLNIVKILQATCNQPIGQYNFIYLTYDGKRDPPRV